MLVSYSEYNEMFTDPLKLEMIQNRLLRLD